MKALQLCHRCCNVRSSDAAVELLCPPDAVVLRELLGQRLEVGEVASFGPIEDGEHLSGSEVLAGEHGQTVYDREREQQRRVDRQVDLHRIPVLRHNEPGEGDQLSIDGDGPAVVEHRARNAATSGPTSPGGVSAFAATKASMSRVGRAMVPRARRAEPPRAQGLVPRADRRAAARRQAAVR